MVSKAAGTMRGWVLGCAVELVAAEPERYFRKVAEMPLVKASNLINGENVDVDKAIALLRSQAQKGSATMELGWLGSLTLNATDVETLARMIQGA